jgi:hypothetical protein
MSLGDARIEWRRGGPAPGVDGVVVEEKDRYDRPKTAGPPAKICFACSGRVKSTRGRPFGRIRPVNASP